MCFDRGFSARVSNVNKNKKDWDVAERYRGEKWHRVAVDKVEAFPVPGGPVRQTMWPIVAGTECPCNPWANRAQIGNCSLERVRVLRPVERGSSAQSVTAWFVFQSFLMEPASETVSEIRIFFSRMITFNFIYTSSFCLFRMHLHQFYVSYKNNYIFPAIINEISTLIE